MEVQSWQFTEKEPQQDVDKTELKAAIDRATAINASEYTTASLTKMYEALETAKEVYENDKADQTAVNDAAKALNDARDALVRVSDKSVLQNLIAKVNGLKESDYTAETWNALQEALKAAVAVDAEHDATQEDVDSAAEALKAAIDALEPATGEDPDKPGTDPGEDPDKPGTTPGEDPDKPGTGSGDSGKQDGDKAVQTGDTLSTGRIAGIVIVMVLAAGTGGAVLYKRVRKNRK